MDASTAAAKIDSRQCQRDGKPITWCASGEKHMPRHTCEWKVLLGILLGSAILCVLGATFWSVVDR
jgi:hypothetical protein